MFVAGAKEGFNLAVMIIPYLVAILSAAGTASLWGLQRIVDPSPRQAVGIPGDVLPLARSPLSAPVRLGSLLSSLRHGPDSLWATLRRP